MNYNISADVFQEPFPHIIFHNFYDESELKLIWEELDFYTKDGKLFEAKDFGCLLYTSPSPRDGFTSRMPSSA